MAIHLNQGAIDNVKEGLRRLHDLLPDYDKAEKCGIDCSEYRAMHDEMEQILRSILAEFDNKPKAG
jgi:hypothetical protein